MHGTGRVVRWDASSGSDAVMVEGLPAEVPVPAGAVETPGDRELMPGELVEIEYEQPAGGAG